MEEQIKKTALRVRTTFAYFWMLPILLVLLGETGGEWVGMYAGDVRAIYMAEWRAAGIACHTSACRFFHLLYNVEQYGCTVCTDRTDGFSVLPAG